MLLCRAMPCHAVPCHACVLHAWLQVHLGKMEPGSCLRSGCRCLLVKCLIAGWEHHPEGRERRRRRREEGGG